MAGMHEEQTIEKAYDPHLMRRLLRYLKPYRGRVAIAVGLLFLISILELVGPMITALALDHAIPDGDIELLALFVALYAGSLVLSFGLEYVQALLTTWLGQQVMYDLRSEIFAHLQGLSLRFFDRNPVGRLMTRVTNDVEALNELFSSGVVTVFGDIFTLVFILVALFILNPALALVTCLVLPLVFVVSLVFRRYVRKAYREIRVRLARINAFMQERLGGMSVVQLFGREEAAYERFDGINRDHLSSHLRSITYYALFFPAIEVLTAIALALILWYGGGQMIQEATTIGTLAAFIQLARRFFRPIQDLSEKYNLLQGAMAASERVFLLLDTEPEVQDPDEPLSLPEPRGEIEFRDVWFRYDPAGEWVLRGVSFTGGAGERVAIVGATGAGKSTIINLLMRFYEAERGRSCWTGCRWTAFGGRSCAAASPWSSRTCSSSARTWPTTSAWGTGRSTTAGCAGRPPGLGRTALSSDSRRGTGSRWVSAERASRWGRGSSYPSRAPWRSIRRSWCWTRRPARWTRRLRRGSRRR
jgi:ATP-binding cassette, subfamily B, multidrug efflux pump